MMPPTRKWSSRTPTSATRIWTGSSTRWISTALASNFGASGGEVWSQGDFNYDGIVNTSDFMMLASDFGQSVVIPASSLATLVPEPAAMGMVALMLGSVMKRRRH